MVTGTITATTVGARRRGHERCDKYICDHYCRSTNSGVSTVVGLASTAVITTTGLVGSAKIDQGRWPASTAVITTTTLSPKPRSRRPRRPKASAVIRRQTLESSAVIKTTPAAKSRSAAGLQDRAVTTTRPGLASSAVITTTTIEAKHNHDDGLTSSCSDHDDGFSHRVQ